MPTLYQSIAHPFTPEEVSVFPSVLVTYASSLLLALCVGASLRAGWILLRDTQGSAMSTARHLYSPLGLAFASALFLVGMLLHLPIVFVLLAACIGYFAGPRWLKAHRLQKARDSFDQGLPEALSIISSSMRAGLTLRDSLTVAASTAKREFAVEAEMALKENRLGVPMEECLDNVRHRVNTPGAHIALGAMIVASRVGGRLPEVLMRIAGTIRERERVAGKLKALTAQGRTQAILVCSAPPVIGIGMYLYDPAKTSILTDTIVGQVLLVVAVVLEVIGIVVTRQIMKLDI